MHPSSLFIICALAFGAVFVLLIFLAVVMRIILAIFPHKVASSDSAIYAAIASVALRYYPGTNIKKIEERR